MSCVLLFCQFKCLVIVRCQNWCQITCQDICYLHGQRRCQFIIVSYRFEHVRYAVNIWVRSASSKFGLAANKCRHAGEDDLPTRARSVMIATNTSANNALAPKMLLDTEGSAWRDVCWYESQSAAMYQWLNIHIAWNTLNKQRFRVFSCNQHTENKMVYLYSKCQQTRGCFN